MSRCEYDTIFRRVFCITLVAIAFTFTVILTNVFIDIDGLLSRRDKAKTFNTMEPFADRKQTRSNPDAIITPHKLTPEVNYDEDTEDSYRSKRSLESQNFLFHMKNPKMKSVLTSRLATLLEELDQEESPNKTERNAKKVLNKNGDKEQDTNVQKEEDSNSKLFEDRKRTHEVTSNEDMLHLTMHNIMLQGIIGHMDLNDVYKKIHQLVNNFKKSSESDESRKRNTVNPTASYLIENVEKNTLENISKRAESEMVLPHESVNEESKFLEEMADCDKLQKDIAEKGNVKRAKFIDNKKDVKIPNVIIKTTIDITSENNNLNNDPKENVKGIIQLIYNGKSVNFNRMDEDIKSNQKFPTTESATEAIVNNRIPEPESFVNEIFESLSEKYQVENNSESYLNNLIGSYIKKNPQRVQNILKDVQTNHKYKTKRYKRQIKIRYKDADFNTEKKPNHKYSEKPDTDELYVEIETHFDSKGFKGEKKKRLIRRLIEKIQQAIHSDIDNPTEENKKKHKHYHVKKRTQHPLDKNRTLFVNKLSIPYNIVGERQSDPITKAVIADQPVPFIADKSGENWKRTYLGPGFLAASKSLNSAELGEVNVDYNKVMYTNKIPQRLQKPLNAASKETESYNTYFDLGDLKFFIKNLEGTGLSIGFNQYTDEPPDPNTMKLFNSIENIISTYHQSHEEIENNNHDNENHPNDPSETEHHDISKRDVSNNQHVLIRRSIKELNKKDYHSNEYKIIFDGKFLPFDNYEEIIEDRNKKVDISINKDNKEFHQPMAETVDEKINIRDLPGVMSDNIFYKKLKPSEILSLASMLNRKKRAMTVKKISNLKKKIKLNKFINTNKKGTKQVLLKKKRHKRQIDKIRIIATDALAKARQSAENIFLVSNENMLADRAVLKEVDTPDTMSVVDIGEAKYENNYPNVIPYTYDDSSMRNIFENKLRHNSLMSKYPHIFMEEVPLTNEDYDPIMVNRIEMKPYKHLLQHHIDRTTQASSTTESVLPKLEEIIGDLPKPKLNYKLTVKITPKNISNIDSGFKEVHTSINKSFNKNGIVYSSLVNVSEISKIKNLRNSTDTTVPPLSLNTKPFFETNLEEQQRKMEILLRQHKKRIEDQLEDLKQEREHLEALLLKNLQQKHESVDITTKKSVFIPQNTRFDIEKLLSTALKHLQTQSDIPPTNSTTQSTAIETTKAPNNEKHIIDSFQKNDNMTNEILHQINKNTELLKTFLEKLTSRFTIEPVKRASEELRSKSDDTNEYWRQYELPFTVQSKNSTFAQIPFVYAFQHPYSDKQNTPVASIVYHGHIHANNLRRTNNNGDNYQKSNSEMGDKNQTRYFIDDLENDYKLAPLEKRKQKESPPLISNNITSVK